jgi:polysaccharide biosynthesis/export protein VpsN
LVTKLTLSKSMPAATYPPPAAPPGTGAGSCLGRIFASAGYLLAGLACALVLAASVQAADPVAPRSPDSSLQISPSTLSATGETNGQSGQASGSGVRPGAPGYRIDAGDGVSVTVYGEPDLSISEVRVKGDGTIAFPLIGDIRVAGLTSQELKALITRELADGYLKKPHVTVSIDKYRLYYIKGEVNRPGGYSFVEGLTVAKAVALAGGFTVRASEDKITLIRESNPERPVAPVNPNTAIFPGDVITVGESFF